MYKVLYKVDTEYESIIVDDIITANILANGMGGVVFNAVVKQ